VNKWPVVVINLQNVGFSSISLTLKEAEETIYELAVKKAFEQYDYVLLIKLVNKICRTKYGSFSKENIRRAYDNFKLDNYEDIMDQIDTLWDFIEKKCYQTSRNSIDYTQEHLQYRTLGHPCNFLRNS
jgi:hypothetical protein